MLQNANSFGNKQIKSQFFSVLEPTWCHHSVPQFYLDLHSHFIVVNKLQFGLVYTMYLLDWITLCDVTVYQVVPSVH